MAIEFDGATAGQRVTWATPPGAVGLSVHSQIIIIYPFTFPSGASVRFICDIWDGNSKNATENFPINIRESGKIRCAANFTTTSGFWTTTNVVLTADQRNHIVIAYDGSSTSNVPAIYIDGSPVAVTTTTTPVGTIQAGSNTDINLGERSTFIPFDGMLAFYARYNRLLSADEALNAYNSRLLIPNLDGLVFAALLAGAAGGVGDGDTLDADNVIKDLVTGAEGVPVGSPILRADDIMNYPKLR